MKNILKSENIKKCEKDTKIETFKQYQNDVIFTAIQFHSY